MSIVTEIIKLAKEMKKFNKTLGIILAILSIISFVANYFNVMDLPVTVVCFAFSVFVGFVAMMQVYHYQEWATDCNPGMFWFVYSATSGILLIGLVYATGFELIENQLAISIMTGFSPTLVPVIGIFVGDLGRIIIKSEPSVI